MGLLLIIKNELYILLFKFMKTNNHIAESMNRYFYCSINIKNNYKFL